MDIKSLMRQAQDMQKNLQKAQEEMANQEFNGTSGGGMVNVTVNGSKEIKKVSLDDSLVVVEEKEILEDLIVAAANDAFKKAEDASSSSMKSAVGNIPLPPGFKL